MSIHDEIKRTMDEGRLFRLEPQVSTPQVRVVYMSVEINNLVQNAVLSGPMGTRCGFMRANLENFVSGSRMTVCCEPFKAKKAQIARLYPLSDEVWDFRLSDPPPNLRVFCRFAAKDVVIALTCSPRSVHVSWLPRVPLMHKHSPLWRRAIRESRSEWNKLFPTYLPLSGACPDDYLSNAILR
jgi:hypothetical protein